MSPTANRPDTSTADRTKRVARRTVLAGSAAALAGCSSLPLTGGQTYERDDFGASLSADCADEGDRSVRVTLAWEWNGDGGSDPRDGALIYWDDEKWGLQDTEAGEAVIFEGSRTNGGLEGARFRHDDAGAVSNTTYAASATLTPTGDFDPAVRNVFGMFVHVSHSAGGTDSDGWFGDLDREWDVGVSNSQAGSACADGES